MNKLPIGTILLRPSSKKRAATVISYSVYKSIEGVQEYNSNFSYFRLYDNSPGWFETENFSTEGLEVVYSNKLGKLLYGN